MSSVKAPPALNLHGPNSSHSISLEDEEMREIEEQQQKQCNSPNSPNGGALKSPKSGKNTLGLTLPGSANSATGICAHSVDSIMQFDDGHSLGTNHHLHLQQPPPPPRSPPRRIILEAEKTLREPTQMNSHHHLLKVSGLNKSVPPRGNLVRSMCEKGTKKWKRV